jgi:hypothetical protein
VILTVIGAAVVAVLLSMGLMQALEILKKKAGE